MLFLFAAIASTARGELPAIAPTSAPATPGATTQEAQRAFAWFDTLGFPDVHGKPLVLVRRSASRLQLSDAVGERNGTLAVLTSSDEKHFSVLTTALKELTFDKTPATTAPSDSTDYESVELKPQAEQLLQTLRAPHATGAAAMWQRFGERMTESAEGFILARICDANNLPDLANELYAAASTVPIRGNQVGGALETRLPNELADSLIWQYVLDFEDPTVSRATLLKEFERFAKDFPKSTHAPLASETVSILQEMVREDSEHPTTRPLAELPIKERVAELIFQLRDQNGHQWSQPGSCDIFADERREKSPASQLVAIGFDAVPQLINALDDTRFTRCVGFHRNFYFSHHVLRVGDCAVEIVERIAGRQFFNPRTTNSAMQKDGETLTTKKLVQDWWKEVQTKGEKQVLIEAVTAGNGNSVSQADRLIAKCPDAALDAIVKGAHAASDEYVQEGLTSICGKLPGESAVPFLRDQMAHGKSLSVRLAAAGVLLNHDVPEAIPAMIAEWKAWPKEDPQDGAGNLMSFLANCNSEQAIAAFAEGLSQRSVVM